MDKPAILGGTPIRTLPLPSYNTIGEREKQAVMRVLDGGELSGFVASAGKEFWGGAEVQALEEEFRAHFGCKHAISVNSATSGLHCAVAAMDLGPGDEVIVPPYTMTATATVVAMMGATPVFADVEDRTFGLEPAAVEAAISPRTRGIMAVNLFGHPARLDELRAIADKHGLFLIEDNAQAPDAGYHGRKTGTIGHAGVFSFNRHKTMQCGEGGVILTDDDRIARKCSLFRNHGEAVVAAMGVDDIVNTMGLNYRLGELNAAVARVQFDRLQELNGLRVALAERLTQGLADLPAITPPVVEHDCSHVYYFYVMKLNAELAGMPRNLFTRAVAAEGFNIRAGYVKPIYLEPMYQHRIGLGRDGFPFTANPRASEISYARGICPTVERLQDSDLFLTNIIYPPLTVTDMDAFVQACRRVLGNAPEIVRADAAGKLAG